MRIIVTFMHTPNKFHRIIPWRSCLQMTQEQTFSKPLVDVLSFRYSLSVLCILEGLLQCLLVHQVRAKASPILIGMPNHMKSIDNFWNTAGLSDSSVNIFSPGKVRFHLEQIAT